MKKPDRQPNSSASMPEPIHVADRDVVALAGSVVDRDGNPRLELELDGRRLAEHGNLVTNALTTVDHTRVRIEDFEHGGRSYRVTAMTVSTDGTLEAWTRADGAVESPAISRPREGSHPLRFVVLAAQVGSLHVLVDPYPGMDTVAMPPDRMDGGG